MDHDVTTDLKTWNRYYLGTDKGSQIWQIEIGNFEKVNELEIELKLLEYQIFNMVDSDKMVINVELY